MTFLVSHSDLETKLQQDRIRSNLGVQGEDINFLKDQRSASKAHMTNLDVQYGKKKEAQLKRKIGPTATSSSQEAASLPDDETSSPKADSEDDKDEEDKEKNWRPKRIPKRIPLFFEVS